MTDVTPRLTSLAHGGGCGCKLAPAVLQDILKGMPQAAPFANLMVGTETSDDAAVWRLNDQQALVATTDFFMPVVDDPFDFGRIAATNALSDIYAMGGTPILALALVGMPVATLSTETIGKILQGGADVCAAAGIPVAGGHSIDSVEPIYGLVALGLVHPDQVLTNRGARAGDVLILTKALGVGVLSAAFKQERLDAAGYAALIGSTTKLNTLGAKLAGRAGMHAVTDVTGFGLLGHALEMARGSGLTVELTARPPLLDGVAALLEAGVRTGASGRNWASYGESVDLPADLSQAARDLLTDPQTSGGLLIAVAADQAEALLALAQAEGFDRAAVVGRVVEGPARVRVAA
ncbi:selenide, water dikinase SelD [Brevundimonas sp. Root1279]|uniref:selenide, water dikinase SelD n=1 Tax=Brevundimonas sp. Root1279 TaxID=1736443 RepID=UPI0006F9CD84|nr:selenide, water dikinase SelD [Brevundimonas sp. Root1279]KQW82325.1 selenide, water dikinase [Brevundimonas sp. Root1279]